MQRIYYQAKQQEQESSINKIALQLSLKADRLQLVKKPRHESTKVNDPQQAHLKYFYECKNTNNLVLPLLEKIVNKTICLEGYTIAEGACEALAQAIPCLDSTQVNRILLGNNGIADHSFSLVL